MIPRQGRRIFLHAVSSALTASLLAAALTAQVASAQNADPAFPVVDGRVYTSAISGGALYVGGQFQHVGPNTGSFACVDLATGGSIPFARIDGTVYVIAPDLEGGWFVGGEFSSVSGVPRANLARVHGDGSLDPRWNPGADAPVLAIVTWGGHVFVGGAFLNAGGLPRRHVAALDRALGQALAWDADADSVVTALALDSGTLWMGGRFAHVGGQPREKIAAVNAGTAAPLAWNTTIAAQPGVWPSVSAIAVDGATVYVAGQFNSIGGQSRTNAAALDATSGLATAWQPFGGGYGYATSILPRGATVLLAGSFAAAGGQSRANLAEVSAATGAATAWDPGTNGRVNAMVVANGRLVVGGSFTTAGSVARANLAELDLATGAATAWDPGAHGAVRAIGWRSQWADTSRVVVGGDRMSVGAVARANLASIDLATGQLTDWSPNVNGWVRSMSREGSTLYFAGSFSQVGGQPRNGFAAIDLASGLPTAWAPGAANDAINCIYAHGHTVYVGGGFTTLGGLPRNHLAALDATTGALTGWNPGANNWVNAVAASDGRVFAGGLFSQLAGLPHAYVGSVDSASAGPLGWQSDATNVVDCLVPDDQGRVYVGGWFTQLGGSDRWRIGRVAASTGALDGWNPSASAPVEAIVPVGSTVYAGGFFTTIGGAPAGAAAILDAASGSALPWNPALYYLPWTLQVADGVVYAGGDLYTAGTLPLSGLAKLFPADVSPPAPQVLAPNGGEFVWQNFEPCHITWTVADDQRVSWVDLEYSIAGPAGPWSAIATALPNTGQYDWAAPMNVVHPYRTTAPARASGPTPAWLRLVARDLAGNSGSDVSDGAFYLPGPGGVDPRPALLTLSVAPNPVRGRGYVGLSLPAPAHVRAGLYDLLGREVARLADAGYEAGPQAFALPPKLAPGVYVVRATVGERTLRRKLVVLD